MKITSIIKSEKKKDFYDIYTDGSFFISLPSDVLLDSSLGCGDELNESELLNLIKSYLDHIYNLIAVFFNISHGNGRGNGGNFYESCFHKQFSLKASFHFIIQQKYLIIKKKDCLGSP